MTSSTMNADPSLDARPGVPWLRELTVLAPGSSPSADFAARVLGQLGARVVTDAAEGAAADVVLVDRIADQSGVPGRATSAAEYLEHVAATNRSVWVSGSAYGLTSSRADAIATDLTLHAASGILGHSRIGPEWAPTVPPGNLALKVVGYVMAVAALHAVHVRRVTGQALHVDVSAQAAVIATGMTLEMAHGLNDCPDEGGSARYGAPSGFFDCRDGAVYVLVLEQHQWESFRRALAPVMDSVETLADARDQADFVNAQMAQWAATRSAEECERILQAAGVPCTEVNTLAVLAERSHAIGRPLDLFGPDAPPLPAVLTEGDGLPRGDRTQSVIPLSDLRVLDAGHVLAVPLAAAWLGAMGAVVTKLEDPQRLDIYRRRGPFAKGVPGLNRSAYFNQLNFCKTSLDHHGGAPGATLDISGYDIVLQNLSPRRAKVMGVDTERLLADGSPKLAISSSGFGRRGPWQDYRAYGHNIHAFAGLVAATRDARGEVGDMGTAWADPLTSAAIAAWVLAWSLAPERASSVGLDISMSELTAAQLTDLVGLEPADIYRNDGPGGDFFVRRPGHPEFLAVSLRSADEVARFEAAVGQSLPTITTLGQTVELEVGYLDELADRLRGDGLAAAVVHTAHDLAHDAFVKSTGLFHTVVSTDLGRYEVTGLPWEFVGQPRPDLRAAPERPQDQS